MKIKKIIEDESMGNRCNSHERLNPRESDLLSALDRLDGRAFSSTLFFIDDENFMSVGGGRDNIYIVFVGIGVDQSLFTLINADSPDSGFCDVVVGGQSGSYPQHQCVDKETAKKALLHFGASGAPDSKLSWDHES
ncbi:MULTISPECIES: Imm1 family immunity protein [unclassified Pseudomonas]|uniref:Imm1 family immunity protein n=1 Tax=unclassified Pseudomonas TaxID=196821 RepID=UPI0015A39BD1|nr:MULTISPECIES: Imm1 family immunity protein [unclassified Pseudomonas]NWC91044.1 histidine kinase [Pseudomonas sp. IPO3779]NWD16523.1 histidine kinase [Pseudomonas sp. IPO3778]